MLYLRNISEQLAKTGSKACRLVEWSTLAENSPSRCIQLIESRVKCYLYTAEYGASTGEFDAAEDPEELRRKPIKEAFAIAVESAPAETWDRLIPCLTEISGLLSAPRKPSAKLGYSAIFRLEKIRGVVRRLLIVAGKVLARGSSAGIVESRRVTSKCNDCRY